MADSGFWLGAGRRRLRRGSRRGPGSEENWAQRAVSAQKVSKRARPTGRERAPLPSTEGSCLGMCFSSLLFMFTSRSMVWAHQTDSRSPWPRARSAGRPHAPALASRPACGHSSSRFPIWIASSRSFLLWSSQALSSGLLES